MRITGKWILVPPAVFLLCLGGNAIWILWAAVLVVPLIWKGTWRWRPQAVLPTIPAVMTRSFLGGVVEYATGTARIDIVGLQVVWGHYLDPASRAPQRNLG